MRRAPAGGIVRVSLDNSWRTPPEILEPVRSYFGGQIPLDPASAPDNPTGARRWLYGAPGTIFEHVDGRNGLVEPWGSGPPGAWSGEGIFCNPPYGGELRDWLAKIAAEAALGREIVALLPVNRTEQAYMHEVLRRARALCLIRGRVKFVSSLDGVAVGGNPYASWLVGLGVDVARWRAAFCGLGLCLTVTA